MESQGLLQDRQIESDRLRRVDNNLKQKRQEKGLVTVIESFNEHLQSKMAHPEGSNPADTAYFNPLPASIPEDE